MHPDYPHLFVLDNPLIKRDVTIIRNKQTPPEFFRSAVNRISQNLAVHLSAQLQLTETEVETPLAVTKGFVLQKKVVLVPVLRAGLGMMNGFLKMLPDANIGHIGIQRNEQTLEPQEYYFKAPKHLEDTETILLDPMLATGGSAGDAISFLKRNGMQRALFACIVAAPQGVENLLNRFPETIIYTAALDEKLNEKGYIVPGLGDAGDRTFGTL